MARCVGPWGAKSAVGKVGCVNFRPSSNGQAVGRRSSAGGPTTSKQLEVRKRFKHILQQWQLFDANTRAIFQQQAPQGWSGWNFYVSCAQASMSYLESVGTAWQDWNAYMITLFFDRIPADYSSLGQLLWMPTAYKMLTYYSEYEAPDYAYIKLSLLESYSTELQRDPRKFKFVCWAVSDEYTELKTWDSKPTVIGVKIDYHHPYCYALMHTDYVFYRNGVKVDV